MKIKMTFTDDQVDFITEDVIKDMLKGMKAYTGWEFSLVKTDITDHRSNESVWDTREKSIWDTRELVIIIDILYPGIKNDILDNRKDEMTRRMLQAIIGGYMYAKEIPYPQFANIYYIDQYYNKENNND